MNPIKTTQNKKLQLRNLPARWQTSEVSRQLYIGDNDHSILRNDATAFYYWRQKVYSAIELVPEIIRMNPAIASLNLVVYEEAPNWRDTPISLEDAGIDFLIRGLQQDQGERTITTLPRCEVSAKNLNQIIQTLPASKLLGLQSNVSLVGGVQTHIPMMDFMCSPSLRNLERLKRLLESLRMGKGFLLESGRSYHYYGTQILAEVEWRAFLGKCLLMTGCADERYVGHQLVNGYCVLRISSGVMKNRAPTVVAEISD